MAGFRGLVDVVEASVIWGLTVIIITGCVMSATYHALVLASGGGDIFRHLVNILANVMLVRWFFSKSH